MSAAAALRRKSERLTEAKARTNRALGMVDTARRELASAIEAERDAVRELVDVAEQYGYNVANALAPAVEP